MLLVTIKHDLNSIVHNQHKSLTIRIVTFDAKIDNTNTNYYSLLGHRV